MTVGKSLASWPLRTTFSNRFKSGRVTPVPSPRNCPRTASRLSVGSGSCSTRRTWSSPRAWNTLEAVGFAVTMSPNGSTTMTASGNAASVDSGSPCADHLVQVQPTEFCQGLGHLVKSGGEPAQLVGRGYGDAAIGSCCGSAPPRYGSSQAPAARRRGPGATRPGWMSPRRPREFPRPRPRPVGPRSRAWIPVCLMPRKWSSRTRSQSATTPRRAGLTST